MQIRLSRMPLIFIFLICLTTSSSIAPVSAKTHSVSLATHTLHAQNTFPPSGGGVVTPQQVSTAKIPQVLTGQEKNYFPPSRPFSASKLLAPQNVVNVPPATTIDPTAHAGQSWDHTQPPDANGVGGTNNYLELINESMAIYGLNGSRQYTTTYDAWFGYSTGTVIFDGVVVWDYNKDRFIFLLHMGAKFLLSVAQQSNGLGNYCNYTFPAYNGDGVDFQKLGVNANGIYFSGNLYNGSQMTNELFVVNRGKTESCAQAGYTDWVGVTNPDGTIANAIVPAVQNGSGNVEYFLNAFPSGACTLTLWALTSGTSLSNTSVATQCYSPPPPAVQKGSPATINPDDSSLDQALVINGLITVTNQGSYDWGDGNGPVGIVEWYVIDPIAQSVVSQGAFGTPGFWLLYPAAIQNTSGNMLFVYNAVGPSIYPSIWYVNQSMTGTQALAQGQNYYYTNSEAPWGDYQSAWLDPITQNSVWITGEYANAASRWSTEFGLVTP